MKICQIVPSLEQRHGGPSRSCLELALALAQTGAETELLTTHEVSSGTTTEGPLSIRTFRRARPVAICRSPEMAAYLASSRSDVYHHHGIWLRTAHYARLAASRGKVPFVVSPRGMMGAWAWDHHRRRKQIASWLVHPGVFEEAAGWHATSEGEAAEIRSLGFRQPVCVAPNGVREPTLAEVAEAAAHWKEAVPEAAERPVALFYSRFHSKKRALELIDLWIDKGPMDWLLLMVGIPEEYTPEMLEEYAARSGGSGRIQAFSGAGRPQPYAIASLFLLPSHNENFGLSIGEALAHGVPILVTDSTPWKEINAVGGGWCVPWADYADALQSAAGESAEKLAERGAAGRKWAVREYSWERPARLLSDFYARLKS